MKKTTLKAIKSSILFSIVALLLIGITSAGTGNDTQPNYENYIDSPVGHVNSYLENGVEVDYYSIPDIESNATYTDNWGNSFPPVGEIKYYGSVYTAANSSIQANLKLPLWLNYTMPARYNATEAPYTIYTLEQGQNVYLDTHYDISNAIAGYGVLAWFASGEPSAEEQPVLLELPYQAHGYYDFYLDPAVFGPYCGNWYKWDGTIKPNENMHAFYLVPTYRYTNMTFSNGTIVSTNMSIIDINTNVPTLNTTEKPDFLPQVRVSDYLQARGDQMSIAFNETWKLWIYGSSASLMDQRDYNGTVNIGAGVMQSLPAGRYKLVQQKIGPYAKDFTLRYNQQTDAYEWFDPKTFSVKTESIVSIKNTWLSYDKLMQILPTTQDRFAVWDVELEEPKITINQMDEIGIRTAKDFYLTDDVKGNVSIERVRGYTNLMPGTKLNVYLDYLSGGRYNKAIPAVVEDNGGPGYQRVWNATVAIYYEGLASGMHTITVMTQSNGEKGVVTQADFMVNEMPSNSFVPAQTVKWVGDVNPWALNTTVQPAQVIEKEVVKEVTVIKEVPPADSVVKAQQMAALYDLVKQIVVCLALCGVAIYARSVYKRYKEKKTSISRVMRIG